MRNINTPWKWTHRPPLLFSVSLLGDYYDLRSMNQKADNSPKDAKHLASY